MSDDEIRLALTADVERFQANLGKVIGQVVQFWNGALPVRTRHILVALNLGIDRHHVRVVSRRKRLGHR